MPQYRYDYWSIWYPYVSSCSSRPRSVLQLRRGYLVLVCTEILCLKLLLYYTHISVDLTASTMVKCDNSMLGNARGRPFNFFLQIIRAAGIPILLENVSISFKLYCVVVNICVYIFYISIVLDLFTHPENLEYTMETARAAAPGSSIIWIYSFLRYITIVWLYSFLKYITIVRL